MVHSSLLSFLDRIFVSFHKNNGDFKWMEDSLENWRSEVFNEL